MTCGQRARGSEYVAWRRNISDRAKNRPKAGTEHLPARSENVTWRRNFSDGSENDLSRRHPQVLGRMHSEHEVPPGIVETPPRTER